MDTSEDIVLANLIALRKAAGLSQKQVEQRLELRVNTLYDIEKGRLKLPFMLAVQLIEAYRADLNDLLAEPRTAPEPAHEPIESSEMVSSLAAIGVIDTGYPALAAAIAEDPVIVAEIGLSQLGTKPLMNLLLAKLTDTQQRYFVLDLYRYINSVISSDGEIRETELSLRDTLIAQAQVALNDSEKKSIARALAKPFFGKSMAKSLPRDAYKHFLIWTLHLVARCDGRAHFKTRAYIQQVAEHIQLPYRAATYIEEQVALHYGNEE